MSTFNEINTALDTLKQRAIIVKAEHDQLIIDTEFNKNSISYIANNSDQESVDSIVEILAQAQTDKTSVLSIVSTLEAKHDAELVAAKLELNTAITAANTKHDAELAVEVQARLDAVAALETKQDDEKATLDAAILAESTARAAEKVITDAAIVAESTARTAKDIEIDAAHSTDAASNMVAFGKIVEVLNERLSD